MGALFFILNLFISNANASTPTPTPSPSLVPEGILSVSKKPGGEIDTYRLIDEQNRNIESRGHSNFDIQNNVASGQNRAQSMVNLLKDQKLQSVFSKLNDKGKQFLQDNPELRNPAAIVTGAASLWIGRTLKLFQNDDLKLSTHVEGRTRSGDFSWESPILNGKLAFTQADGMNMKVNRKITSINTQAEMNYNPKDQIMSGQLSHPLIPNLDLTFGTTQYQQTNQTDGRAALRYNLNF